MMLFILCALALAIDDPAVKELELQPSVVGNFYGVALALVVSVVAPSVLAIITGWQRRADKQEDYRRQDQVAALAKQANDDAAKKAQDVADQAASAAKLLVDDNKKVATAAIAASTKVQGKLEVIHTLVNSNLTDAIQSNLDSVARELSLLHRLPNPTDADTQAMVIASNKITSMQKVLDTRHKSADMAAQQIDITTTMLARDAQRDDTNHP
jgi:hypothetical protein